MKPKRSSRRPVWKKKQRLSFASTSKNFKYKKGLDDIARRVPRTKALRRAISGVLTDKMDAETLKSHLTSVITSSQAQKVLRSVPMGTAMTVKQLIDAAKEQGGYKELLPTDGDMEMLEQSPTFSEDSRIGLDMGTIYKKAIILTRGMKRDAQMRTAQAEYKGQTWPCFNSASSKYYTTPSGSVYNMAKLLRSDSGTNRQGVWYPINLGHDTGTWTNTGNLQLNCYQQPMLLRSQYYDEIRNYLLSQDTIDWLEDDDNMSASLYFAINSVTDTITFANGQKYLPVELKIYICKCKTRTKYAPGGDWFSPTGESDPYNLMRDDYIYPQTSGTRPHPTQGGSSLNMFSESSVHLGATPFYSPTFRNNWEVCHLVKQEILPSDKFELTLHRQFRHCHDLRQLETERQTLEKGYYCEGDYALLITYRGLPCIMKYTGTVSGATLDSKEVDASPSRIFMTSRSSMNISVPNLKKSSMVPSERGDNNYIAGEGRVLDVNIQTHDYSDTDWAPSVMTNVEEQEGGGR